MLYFPSVSLELTIRHHLSCIHGPQMSWGYTLENWFITRPHWERTIHTHTYRQHRVDRLTECACVQTRGGSRSTWMAAKRYAMDLFSGIGNGGSKAEESVKWKNGTCQKPAQVDKTLEYLCQHLIRWWRGTLCRSHCINASGKVKMKENHLPQCMCVRWYDNLLLNVTLFSLQSHCHRDFKYFEMSLNWHAWTDNVIYDKIDD